MEYNSTNSKIEQISVNDIIPNRFQPRKNFDPKLLNELADSIKQYGIVQPLVLRKLGEKYEIIAGERRYKAACMIGLTTVPAIVMDLDDTSSAEIALIENVQRRDLTAIEEAKSYKQILGLGQIKQEELAKKIGKTQSTISNKLRLLKLSEEAQQALLDNKISERHARSLLRLKDQILQTETLNRIIEKRMTVRETDKYIKDLIENHNAVEQTEEILDFSDESDMIKDKKGDNMNDNTNNTPVIDNFTSSSGIPNIPDYDQINGDNNQGGAFINEDVVNNANIPEPSGFFNYDNQAANMNFDSSFSANPMLNNNVNNTPQQLFENNISNNTNPINNDATPVFNNPTDNNQQFNNPLINETNNLQQMTDYNQPQPNNDNTMINNNQFDNNFNNNMPYDNNMNTQLFDNNMLNNDQNSFNNFNQQPINNDNFNTPNNFDNGMQYNNQFTNYKEPFNNSIDNNFNNVNSFDNNGLNANNTDLYNNMNQDNYNQPNNNIITPPPFEQTIEPQSVFNNQPNNNQFNNNDMNMVNQQQNNLNMANDMNDFNNQNYNTTNFQDYNNDSNNQLNQPMYNPMINNGQLDNMNNNVASFNNQNLDNEQETNMYNNPNLSHTMIMQQDITGAVAVIRNTIMNLQNNGYGIETNETDLGNLYQIVINFKK